MGINIDLGAGSQREQISSSIGRATDLSEAAVDLPSRNEISAKLIEAIFTALEKFESDGFDRFLRAWDRFDWLRGQRIGVTTPTADFEGVAQGVDENGALILRTGEGQKKIVSGSVYLPGQRAIH